jgi:LacI family gluconate utilization system Gnt-I transcriptional repressor
MSIPASRPRRASGRATLADVARLADVSPMTASRALRGATTVDQALSQKVREAARKLGYVPDPAARALASQRSSHVAILVPSLTNSLFVDLLEEAQGYLRQSGYQTLIGVTHYDADEEAQLVQEQLLHRPAGLLLTGTPGSRGLRELMEAHDAPCVHMMEILDQPGACSVGFSQVEAAVAMTTHLLERGRRRIAFVAAQLDERTLQRLQGWKTAMQRAGLYDERLEWRDPTPSSIGLGAEMLPRLLDSPARPDAVFFCNDDLAQGALMAALRMGVDVPGRVAVAGFNDLPLSEHTVPRLTTVRTPRGRVGREAATLLVQLMRGETVREGRVDLGFELVVRETS